MAKKGSLSKGNFKVLQREGKILCAYLSKNCWWILISCCILLCTYSTWLISPDLHIDPDIYIMQQGSKWMFETAGRQGLSLLNLLFGLQNLNPNFEVCVGWIMVCIASILFGYLCYRSSLQRPWLCAFLGLFLFVSPCIVEQFYWYQRIFPIAVGYIFCMLAAGISYYGIVRKNRLCDFTSILLMLWAFSIYQSFPFVYITIAVLVFLLLYRRFVIIEKRKNFPIFRMIGCQVLFFFVALMLNIVITQTFFYEANTGVYEYAIHWSGTSALRMCKYVIQGLLGGTIYTSAFYFFLGFATLSVALAECLATENRSGRIFYVLASVALQVSPFLMAIVSGGEPSPHVQLSYSMVFAGDIAFLSGTVIKHKRTIYVVTVLLAGILIWNQGQTVMRLLYTDHIRIEEDMRVATEIEMEVQNVTQGEEKPILFLGTYANQLNPASLRGEYIGRTIFGWDRGAQPHYIAGSVRTSQILNTIGIPFQGVTSEETVANARRLALEMPSWPLSGSVKDIGDCIIVKLCEDEWPEDILDPKVTSVDLSERLHESTAVEDVQAVIDDAKRTNDHFVIKGWVRQENNARTKWKPHIYLLDLNTKAFVEIATVKTGRSDFYIDGESCPNAGFTAIAPEEILKAIETGSSIILFGYENTGTGNLTLKVPQILDGTELKIPKAGLPEKNAREKVDYPVYQGFQFNGKISAQDGGVILNGSEGDVLYGPYAESVAGTYDITLNYKVLSYTDTGTGTGGNTGLFDIAIDDHTVATVDLSTADSSVQIKNVTLEDGGVFEARVWVPDGMVLEVKSICYCRV